MKPIYVLSFSVIFMAACHSSSKISYPHTQKENVTDHYFGTEVADPYRWLENDTSAATAAWVKAQNEVTFNYLEKIPFRNSLKNRLTELNDYPKLGAPFKKHGNIIFSKIMDYSRKVFFISNQLYIPNRKYYSIAIHYPPMVRLPCHPFRFQTLAIIWLIR
jgi:hypothetical protein